MEKERKDALINLKKAKNKLASCLKKINGIEDPYHYANILFGWYILDGIYDRKTNEIRKDLSVDSKFSIEQYMSVEHLNLCTTVITQYCKHAVEPRQGNTLTRTDLGLKDNAKEQGRIYGIKYKKELEEKTGRRVSIYTDLLKGINENMKSEANQRTTDFNTMFDETASWYKNTDLTREEQASYFNEHPEALYPDYDESDIKSSRK